MSSVALTARSEFENGFDNYLESIGEETTMETMGNSLQDGIWTLIQDGGIASLDAPSLEHVLEWELLSEQVDYQWFLYKTHDTIESGQN